MHDAKVTHTPGPWEIAQGTDAWDFIVAEATGNTICEPNFAGADFSDLDPSVHNIAIEEAKANARLISAAPDLLAACRLFAEWYDKDSTELKRDDAFYAARAAIAKATGGAQ